MGTAIAGSLGFGMLVIPWIGTHGAQRLLVALSAVAGGLIGLRRTCQRHPERGDDIVVDQLAEAELRLLGVPADEAARLVAPPLPPIEAW